MPVLSENAEIQRVSCCKISLQVDENKGNKKFLGEVTTPISLQKNKGGGWLFAGCLQCILLYNSGLWFTLYI